MITPTNMLDWSVQWMPVAEDGFKAEMIWLADYFKLASHPAVNGLTFTDPEWEYFAFKIMPSAYKNPNRRKQWGRQYEIWQEQAIYDIGTTNLPIVVDVTDNANLAVHKVVWANQFGRKRNVQPANAETIMQAALNTLDDDLHAKCILALRMQGDLPDMTRLDTILAAIAITPQNYHALLCALIAKEL